MRDSDKDDRQGTSLPLGGSELRIRLTLGVEHLSNKVSSRISEV